MICVSDFQRTEVPHCYILCTLLASLNHHLLVCCKLPLVQAKNVLIATGSYAVKAPIEGSEHGITSDEVLNLEQLPEK